MYVCQNLFIRVTWLTDPWVDEIFRRRAQDKSVCVCVYIYTYIHINACQDWPISCLIHSYVWHVTHMNESVAAIFSRRAQNKSVFVRVFSNVHIYISIYVRTDARVDEIFRRRAQNKSACVYIFTCTYICINIYKDWPMGRRSEGARRTKLRVHVRVCLYTCTCIHTNRCKDWPMSRRDPQRARVEQKCGLCRRA